MKPHLYPEQQLKRRAMSWAVQIRVNPVGMRFEELKDRWGYCSPAGEVTFALDLVGQDERFQDYVIVHELLHLRVRSHGKRFRAMLSAYVPEWRDLDAPGPARRGCGVGVWESGNERDVSSEGKLPEDIPGDRNNVPTEVRQAREG
jgi:hypothetical protein